MRRSLFTAVSLAGLASAEPARRRLPPALEFCTPVRGSGDAVTGRVYGDVEGGYAGYRVLLLVSASADGSMGWWDKSCGFVGHAPCPGGGQGYAVEDDGSFSLDGWAR